MFNEIRAGLINAYKHKTIEDKKCVICGREQVPLALHVIEYSHSDTMPIPEYFVPMSQSQGRIRGSVPICHHCCPPCKKCDLPIATKWIAKIKEELARLHPEIHFSIGNGFCQHINIGKDIGAIFKKVRLDGVDVERYNKQKCNTANTAPNNVPISAEARKKDHEMGMSIVADDLRENGYVLQSVNRDMTKSPQMVVEKDGQLYFVIVAVDRIRMPTMRGEFKERCLHHASTHKAKVFFAPVSLMPTGKRNAQGEEGFYVKYTGFSIVEDGFDEIESPGLLEKTIQKLIEQQIEAAKQGKRIVNRIPESVRRNLLKGDILKKLNKMDRSQVNVPQGVWEEIDSVDLSGALGDIGKLFDRVKDDLPRDIVAKLEFEARQEDIKTENLQYNDIEIIYGK